jgi:hypothetical protein
VKSGRLVVLVLVLALSLVAGQAGARAAPAPVTAESLLAAVVPWSTVQQVAGPDWWPQLPQFDVPPIYHDPAASQPSLVVTQWFVQVGSDAAVLTKLLAYPTRARARYCDVLVDTYGTGNTRAPLVGESHLFWAVREPDGARTTVLCFTRGAVVAELKVYGQWWTAARVVRLARPIDERLRALQEGRLVAPAVTSSDLAVLPAGSAAPGAVLGTVALRPEAWAALSTTASPSPQAILAQLRRGGVQTLPFRRYQLRTQAENVVEVTLFAFKNAQGAARWFDTLATAAENGTKLSLDATGARSGFWQFEDYFALDFVAGRFLADVTCRAPYGPEPSGTCVAAMQKLAARWYAQLSRR